MSDKIAVECCMCGFKISDDTVMEIHTNRLSQNEKPEEIMNILRELISEHTENGENGHEMRIREDLLYEEIE